MRNTLPLGTDIKSIIVEVANRGFLTKIKTLIIYLFIFGENFE